MYVAVDKYDTIDRAVEAIRVSLGLGPDVMLRLMEVMKLSCTPCSLDEMCSILPPTSYEKSNLSCSDLVVEEVTKVRYETTGCYFCLDMMMLCFQFQRVSGFGFLTTTMFHLFLLALYTTTGGATCIVGTDAFKFPQTPLSHALADHSLFTYITYSCTCS